ncbi:NAD-dependent epimerase/dehydratase family protein [Paenibacillus sacheonensis]|uniref:NAD-dependent epimerase/dehydratase family protein n=1 Tax=Paenibacillus sacheonensis TaxID=742054 RepID=A0A7X4YL78_9BACL|nr:NAD-dependent epimerase/dehydratase family protein [Paenibacillus sacheonensis]MBM7563081.1 UDP-glucose 4-epimerase [Paenibacillus sacheonensis]NBC68350.1 NAD-dependent epimerase/dehydratase family protein [Paenibacillus sacheonensis]
MKAVVTGGAGFIGSRLVDALIGHGAEVHVLDNLSTGNRGRLHAQAVLHQADIRDPEAKAILAGIQPDTLFHLAAQADVQRSIQEPGCDAGINIAGTVNMLDACRESGVRKFIFASTSAVYGKLERMPLAVTDPVQPISYYGLSKLTAEHYIRLYHAFYGLNYTILRYGNVYGPGQTAKGEGGVIAIFMERLKNNLTLPINGDGEQTRDFVYVDDVAAANIAAVKLGDRGTYHVSTGSRTSINHVVRELQRIRGEAVTVQYRDAKEGDIRDSCLDNRLTTAELAWQPAVPLEEGLLLTYKSWQQQT